MPRVLYVDITPYPVKRYIEDQYLQIHGHGRQLV